MVSMQVLTPIHSIPGLQVGYSPVTTPLLSFGEAFLEEYLIHIVDQPTFKSRPIPYENGPFLQEIGGWSKIFYPNGYKHILPKWIYTVYMYNPRCSIL